MLKLQDLNAAGFDLTLTGFDDTELARLLAEQDAAEGFRRRCGTGAAGNASLPVGALCSGR